MHALLWHLGYGVGSAGVLNIVAKNAQSACNPFAFHANSSVCVDVCFQSLILCLSARLNCVAPWLRLCGCFVAADDAVWANHFAFGVAFWLLFSLFSLLTICRLNAPAIAASIIWV